MKVPERLNVLVCREHNGLTVIGNMKTFTKSAQGRATCVPFFELLKAKDYLQNSFPGSLQAAP